MKNEKVDPVKFDCGCYFDYGVQKLCAVHRALGGSEIMESLETHCVNCGKLYIITNPPDEMPHPKDPEFSFCPSCLSTEEGTTN